MMNFNDQNRECHPERSKGSDVLDTGMLRCAQDDNLRLVLIVKIHHRSPAVQDV
jgi:hypothetical protein